MTDPKVFPVIHYANDTQAFRNAEIVVGAGCPGLFLIDMEGRAPGIIVDAASEIANRFPDLAVGVNFLRSEPGDATLASARLGLAMTWTDEQLTHSAGPWIEAGRVSRVLVDHPGHQVFCGLAFKHQPFEPDPFDAARRAIEWGFIPTTSGPATGMPADPSTVARLRAEIGPDAPLAIASGITPSNALSFVPHVTHILVATGVSTSFFHLDPLRLADLMGVVCP